MKKYIFYSILLAFLLPAKVYACEDTYISDTAYNACIRYGEEYGICHEFLMAAVESESSGQADAENNGCMGLMQVNVTFHAERMERLGCTDIFDEDQNIHVAADYLSELFEKYDDACQVLMCYNMGESRAQKLFNQGIYESGYALEILERTQELERLHGK